MRVHVDGQVFAHQSRGGISRYFTELLRCFAADPNPCEEYGTDFSFHRNEHYRDLDRGVYLPMAGPRALRLLNAPTRALTGRPDLVHQTYFDRRWWSSSARSVVTVYDMIPELFPAGVGAEQAYIDKKGAVEAADLVLCISDTTRRDLLAAYGSLTAPVLVTPLAAGSAFHPQPGPAWLPQNSVLFVGSRHAYKAFDVLLRAFPAFRHDHVLMALGGGPLTAAESSLVADLGLAECVRQREVDDGDLAAAFAGAKAFVFPSHYEGFGLPTLEAMASGCPVVISTAPALMEVAGGAAEVFEAGEPEALVQALEAVLHDPSRASILRERGLERASDFSWAATAELTRAAYRDQVGS